MKSFRKKLNDLNLKDHIDTIVENFYDGNWAPFFKKKDFDLDPAVELKELKKYFVVKTEIPGFKKEDLHIQVDDQMLIIEGEKVKEQKMEDDEFCHYSELSYGKFKRIIQLPKVIDVEHVKASFKDGILSIHLKKSEETKNRKVVIE